MASIQINYSNIIKTLKDQFDSVLDDLKSEAEISSNPEVKKIYDSYYKDLKIYLEDEQMFIKKKELDKNGLYIVVRFSASSFNFATTVAPVSLMALSTDNRIKPTQHLFQLYCSKYNLEYFNDENNGQRIQQIWQTPNVAANFIAFYDAFRSLVTLGGYLVIGQDVTSLGTMRYIYDEENYTDDTSTEAYVDVPVLQFSDSFSTSFDTQPFGNIEGFVKSEASFSTYGFSITTYSLNNKLCSDLLEVKHFRKNTTQANQSVKGPNDYFTIILFFNNDYTNKDSITGAKFFERFKIQSINFSQVIGDVPKVSVTFVR